VPPAAPTNAMGQHSRKPPSTLYDAICGSHRVSYLALWRATWVADARITECGCGCSPGLSSPVFSFANSNRAPGARPIAFAGPLGLTIRRIVFGCLRPTCYAKSPHACLITYATIDQSACLPGHTWCETWSIARLAESRHLCGNQQPMG
jgi:hypothetical protein